MQVVRNALSPLQSAGEETSCFACRGQPVQLRTLALGRRARVIVDRSEACFVRTDRIRDNIQRRAASKAAAQALTSVKQTIEGDVRRVKGTSILQLVKVLRDARQKRPLRMSPAASSFLEQRILPNGWYPVAMMVELLGVLFEQLQRSDERVALQGGIDAARQALSGPYSGFVSAADPSACVMSLRHLWRASYDFGQLEAHGESARSVVFTLSGFPDITLVHAILVMAWAVAAAQVKGGQDARGEIIERPWQGARVLRYRVCF